ncbi:MAG: flavin reductase family protein [Solirubrobacterales bacterium]|nr:flavin reductase family protein [Solirubrobacterales bacterium]
MSRVGFDPASHPGGVYRLLNSVVVPRPIAWVSTRSPEGVDNLAPHSFFTIACAEPPIVQFTSIGRKDSLANATATGEFVVNLAPEHLFEEVNASATDFPPDHDEFAEVGIEREPSARVSPPRVAGSPVAIECVLERTQDFGTSVVVFGRVVLVAVAEDALVDGHPDIRRLRPLARLGRRQWSTIGEVREIARIRFDDWRQTGGD